MSDRNPTTNQGKPSSPPKTLEEIKAEARAYALGQTKTSRPTKHKNDSTTTAASRLPSAVAVVPAPSPQNTTTTRTTTTTSTNAEVVTAAKDGGPATRRLPPPPALTSKYELGDVYAHFVNLLGQDDDQTNLSFLMLDDDEEFQFDSDSLDDDDEDDEDEDDEDEHSKQLASTDGHSILLSPLPIWDSDHNVPRELSLQEELNLLEEEDMQAAVATLLEHPLDNNNNNSNTNNNITNAMEDDDDDEGTAHHHGNSNLADEDASVVDESADPTDAVQKPRAVSSSAPRPTALPEMASTTPIREAARLSHRVVPTQDQQELLRSLLEQHHQLLLQQTVLAVRAANAQSRRRVMDHGALPLTATPEFVHGTESGEDLVEVLDSAVGMLQDLDQNRKDAIRSEIQLDSTSANHSTTTTSSAVTVVPKRSLLFDRTTTAMKGDRPSAESDDQHHDHHPFASGRPLTRAQFTRALLEQNMGQARTVFDVQGLSKQKETFYLIDTSVDGKRLANTNILLMETNAIACEYLLRHCGATIDADMIPGARDLSTNFVDIREYLGQDFTPPCTHSQELMLKRNRNLFTAGEDNLVLRGVNLYGEKQWALISDRFMPERSINIISQRHGTLCYMLYKSRGIEIDDYGELAEPPKHDSIDDVDAEAVKTLEKVPPPAILNVHRWSMDEDLILLKAVPLFGPMWAEIRVRLLPHRDRGHIRKRYQVLERRIKATWNRIKKQFKVISYKLAKNAASVSTNVQPIVSASSAAAPTLATNSRTSMRRVPASSPQRQGEALPLPLRRSASSAPHSALSPPVGAAAAVPQYMTSPVPLSQAMMGSPGQPVLHPPVYYPPPPYAVSHGYPMYPAPSYYYVPIAYHQPYPQSSPPPLPPPHHGDGHMPGNGHGPWYPMQTEQHQPYRMENETEAATTIAGLASNANQTLANNEGHNPAKRLKTDEVAGIQAHSHYESSYPPAGNFESPDKASRASAQIGTTPLPLFSPPQLSPGIVRHGNENLAAGLNENTLDGFDLQAAMLAADTNDTSQGAQIQKPQASPGSPPQHKPLFGDEATLMENDLEAISALNSLSRSRGTPATDATSVQDEKPRAMASKKTANSGQSLFAKVVGDANEKTKSRSSKRKRVQ